MLELQNVHTYYGPSHILQGVNFTVPKGKCIGLIGRNGAGKTTTIHTISGLIRAKMGTIRFMDEDIQAYPSYRIARRGVGLVPQGRRIFPNLTVKENLTVVSPETIKKNGHANWDIEDVYRLFPVLKERENNMGTQLSGGQQQMLAIGRALMTNPNLLLMDEPSEGLAPVVIEQVGEIIRELKETGLSILMVEQNISLAYETADEIIIMNKGTIVWKGTPEELMADEGIQQKYLGV